MFGVTVKAYRFLKLLQAQRWSQQKIDELNSARLRGIVRHAYDTVPYYREVFDSAGLSPQDIRNVADIALIPITEKQSLQSAGPDAVTSRAFDPKSLTRETTSGSSGRPLEIRFDQRWLEIRQAMFLRALSAAGYFPGMKMLLIASRHRVRPPAWLRWRHVSHRSAPEELLGELEEFRPHFLYGWVTPIRRMAEAVRAGTPLAHKPKGIVTTAETLDKSTRSLIESSFGCRIFEIYGMTEMGAMSWECRQHDGLHLAGDTVIVEFLPREGGGDTCRLVSTNLELRGMPFLRYDCGDLAVRAPAGNQPCACGSKFEKIDRVEGRLVDCVILGNGRTISPYELTTRMEQVPGLARYQIRQTGISTLEARFVPGHGVDNEAAARQITAVLREFLGPEIVLRPIATQGISQPAGRKFRVVESLVSAESGK